MCEAPGLGSWPLRFSVRGRPVSKGSALVIAHRTTGRPIYLHDAGARLVAWTDAIRGAALVAAGARPLLDGPCCVAIEFRLPRPAKPRFPRPATRGLDADKGLRAVFDALQGVLFLDDAAVVEAVATKVWAAAPELVGAAIEVSPLDGCRYVARGLAVGKQARRRRRWRWRRCG